MSPQPWRRQACAGPEAASRAGCGPPTQLQCRAASNPASPRPKPEARYRVIDVVDAPLDVNSGNASAGVEGEGEVQPQKLAVRRPLRRRGHHQRQQGCRPCRPATHWSHMTPRSRAAGESACCHRLPPLAIDHCPHRTAACATTRQLGVPAGSGSQTLLHASVHGMSGDGEAASAAGPKTAKPVRVIPSLFAFRKPTVFFEYPAFLGETRPRRELARRRPRLGPRRFGLAQG